MGKIGRNDPCPCRSGLKYKKCCQKKERDGEERPVVPDSSGISLSVEVEKIRKFASEKKEKVLSIGVFILFSSESGDAWLLEISDMDALKVSENGEDLEFKIEENPETLEINWSHRFAIKKKKFVVRSYINKSEETYSNYPTHRIISLLKRITSKLSPEIIDNIHIDNAESADSEMDKE